MTDFVALFESELERAGIPSETPIKADGQLHRYRVAGDAKGRMNGWYRVIIDGDFCFAAFGCNKRGINEKWHTKIGAKEYTSADKERIRQRQEQIKKAEAESTARAAVKARELWTKAQSVDAHPYAERKGIPPRNVRQLYGKLVVPMYGDDGGKMQIVGLQFIDATGMKRFLTDARKIGCYASVNESGNSREVIHICEGYATAVSIYEAVHTPVVVAFDAGNLLPVAKVIRGKYPAARIIIAADNDQWTKKPDGTPWNPGIEGARAAAEAVGGRAVWPQFAHDAADKPTDFNDLHALAGLEAVREALVAEPEEPKIEAEIAENVQKTPDNVQEPGKEVQNTAPPNMSDWKRQLIQGKVVVEGFPFPYDAKSKFNSYLFLKHEALIEGMLIYNEFSDEVLIARCPPWDDPEKFKPHSIKNDEFFMIAAWLERVNIKVGQDVAGSAAVRVAMENPINPPKEYFERLKWDGKQRLDNWLLYYLGAEAQPAEYLRLVGSKWLIGAVMRVYEPGAKFDSVLILEGEQDLGKSTAFRLLATFGEESLFLDSVGDVRNKDTLMAMQGKLIIELAELASFKKAENEEIKGFISRQVDEYRPPYGRTNVKRPRRFVFGGTVNPEGEEGYLTDNTGNRRYWPVRCGKIDLEALSADRYQLWAEAVYRYKQGERTWLSREEVTYSTAEQRKRQIEDAWQDNIEDIIKNEWRITVDEICKKLELKPRDVNNQTKKRIKNSLRMLGWVENRQPGEGRIWNPRERGVPQYKKSSEQSELELESVIE